MSLTNHLSTIFIISFFKNLVWNRLSAVNATYVVPVVSDNRQPWFVFFIVLIHSCNYISTYIQLTYFILSIVFLNTISTGFVVITEKKVSLSFFVLKVVSKIWLVLLSRKTWSRCLILTDHLSTLFVVYFFKNLVQNRLSAATVTVVAKGIFRLLILTKVRDKQITLRYSLFCEALWRKSGAHLNCLFNFVLSISTFVPDWRYRDSNTLNISVMCIGFFISLRRAYQLLVW